MNGKTKAKIVIEITSDQMAAFMHFDFCQEGNDITYEAVINALEKKGVCFGINHDKIKDVLNNALFSSKIKVAEGLPVVQGLDGKIKYYFQTERDLKPKIDDSGRADFFNLNAVINVGKDQLLAEIIPPTEEKEGMTVTGKTIPAKKGRIPLLLPGKNVYTSEDKLRFYSSIDGHPLIYNNRISVNPILEINGDVGPKTGNIDFVGSVIVKGNIGSGYKIKSGGDVEVYGVVEAAEIYADGSILLHRGVQGRDKGFIKAGVDVIAKYVENTNIDAGREIIVSEAVMHSSLNAGRRIKVVGRKGLLVGGISKAGEEIQAKTIGSYMATRTEIEVGADPKKKTQLQQVTNKLEEIEENLRKVIQSIALLNRLKQNEMLTKDREILLQKLINTKEELEQQKDECEITKKELGLMMQIYERAKVSVSNTIFPGVIINIGNASLRLREKIEHATFYNSESQIKFTTYLGG